MFQDRVLNWRDCGSEFTFTASEQEFYQEKGFKNDPARCPDCRKAKKANSRGGGGGGGGFGNRERQMYDAVCSDCGKPTQVPFKPREDRPVYCRECYSMKMR
jgi:CxxC-x17-CxxC domain-containing protein